MLEKQQKRLRRHKRVRAKIFGTKQIPRFCVFRSNRYIYGQLIDDEKGITLVAKSDEELNPKVKIQKSKAQVKSQKLKKEENNEKIQEKTLTGKVANAFEVGRLIAEKAIEKKIKKVKFDRGGYRYHGRVKAIAEGARKGGLQF